jgi:ornithine carbamoyltransferase
VNALTDLHHPCQILADLFTIQEVRGRVDGTRVAFLGDGNNVCHSWLEAAALLPLDLRIGVGVGYDPDSGILEQARRAGVSEIRVFRDPREAVKGAHVIYTDVWASMGQEDEAAKRKRDLASFQVNRGLVELADPAAIVMHCLPAHRGEEITDEVIDSERSVVFQEAENRLHTQKALLVHLLGKTS